MKEKRINENRINFNNKVIRNIEIGDDFQKKVNMNLNSKKADKQIVNKPIESGKLSNKSIYQKRGNITNNKKENKNTIKNEIPVNKKPHTNSLNNKNTS